MTCNDIIELSPVYLSGELDAARASDFAAHLDACSGCAREIREHKVLDARLRDVILDESVDTSGLDRRIREQVALRAFWRRPARWISAAASVAAALVVGLVFYRVSQQSTNLYADAAEDHRREVVEQQPRRWISDGAAVDAMALGQGVPASGIHAPELSGYRLDRAKLCRLNGRLFLHLVYSDGAQEYSVFLRPREAEPITGPATAADRGGEHLAAFRTAALTALVVSGQSSDSALRLARFAARAL